MKVPISMMQHIRVTAARANEIPSWLLLKVGQLQHDELVTPKWPPAEGDAAGLRIVKHPSNVKLLLDDRSQSEHAYYVMVSSAKTSRLLASARLMLHDHEILQYPQSQEITDLIANGDLAECNRVVIMRSGALSGEDLPMGLSLVEGLYSACVKFAMQKKVNILGVPQNAHLAKFLRERNWEEQKFLFSGYPDGEPIPVFIGRTSQLHDVARRFDSSPLVWLEDDEELKK